MADNVPEKTKANPFGKAGLNLVPFTPVPFSGPDSVYAWGRLLGYSAIAAAIWGKSRRAGYLFAGAAAVSLLTSLGGDAYNGGTK